MHAWICAHHMGWRQVPVTMNTHMGWRQVPVTGNLPKQTIIQNKSINKLTQQSTLTAKLEIVLNSCLQIDCACGARSELIRISFGNSWRSHSKLIQNSFRTHSELVQNSCRTHSELFQISLGSRSRKHTYVESEFNLNTFWISYTTRSELIQNTIGVQTEFVQNWFEYSWKFNLNIIHNPSRHHSEPFERRN